MNTALRHHDTMTGEAKLRQVDFGSLVIIKADLTLFDACEANTIRVLPEIPLLTIRQFGRLFRIPCDP